MNWASTKQYFSDHGALIDIYYEDMREESWTNLFNWLSANDSLDSVNCYSPEKDENFEEIPDNVADLLNEKGFYCFVSVLINDITLFLRFYEKDELECDISPKEIESEEKLKSLLTVLDEIKNVTGVSNYVMCPENSKENVFYKNGVFIN